MNRRIASWMGGTAIGLLAAGCISNQTTVRREVERTKIEFESEAAARMFYETQSKSSDKNRSESHTTVEVPFIFHNERRVVPGRNEEFNHAVTVCDSNQDGKITELEARIFAEHGYGH